MRDNWLNHNTDKLLLYSLVVIFASLILYSFAHGGSEKMLDWEQDTCATILGALLLILTGRLNRADGQTDNGVPTTTQNKIEGGD